MSISKNISSTVLSQIIVVLIGFVNYVLIARILGAEIRGDYALYVSSVGLASVCLGFSLPTSVIYFVSSKKEKANEIFASLITFSLIAFVFLIGIVLIFKQTKIDYLIFPKQNNTTFWVFFFCFHFLVTILNSLVPAFLNSLQKFNHISLIAVLANLISLFGYVYIYANRTNLSTNLFSWVLFVTVFSLLAQLLAHFYFYMKYIPEANKINFLSLHSVKSIFTYSLLAWLCNAIQFLSYRFDLWILSYYHTNSVVGVYAIAVSLIQMLWIIPNAVSSVLFSYISQSNEEEATDLAVKFSSLTFWIVLPLGCLSVIIFYYFIPIVFGVDYQQSFIIILLLLPGIIAMSFPIILSTFFGAKGRLDINLFSTIICFAITIPLDFFLIPRYSYYGAAIASTLGYSSFIVTHTIIFLRKYNKNNDYRISSFVRLNWNYFKKIYDIFKQRVLE